jgi:hypothetical protein
MKRFEDDVTRAGGDVASVVAHRRAETLLGDLGERADDADAYVIAADVVGRDVRRDKLQERLDAAEAVADLAMFRLDELGLAGNERALLAEIESVGREFGVAYYEGLDRYDDPLN